MKMAIIMCSDLTRQSHYDAAATFTYDGYISYIKRSEDVTNVFQLKIITKLKKHLKIFRRIGSRNKNTQIKKFEHLVIRKYT